MVKIENGSLVLSAQDYFDEAERIEKLFQEKGNSLVEWCYHYEDKEENP